MTRTIQWTAACLTIVAALASSPIQAGERATTSELPPALAAMGVGSSSVMTRTEAQQVRGEGLLVFAGAKAHLGLGAKVHAPIVGKVSAAAKVNLNIGIAGSLLGSHCGRCY